MAAPARPSQAQIWCNRIDCAKVLGISPRYFDELIKEKGLYTPVDGRYDLKEVVPAYIKHVKGATDKAGLTEARKSLVEKQVEKTSIQIELSKGTLHRAEDVKAVTSNMVAVTRSRLLEVPNRIAHKVLALKDHEAVKSVIQAEIHTALSEMAEYDPAKYFKRAKDFLLMGGADDDYTDDADTE